MNVNKNCLLPFLKEFTSVSTNKLCGNREPFKTRFVPLIAQQKEIAIVSIDNQQDKMLSLENFILLLSISFIQKLSSIGYLIKCKQSTTTVAALAEVWYPLP
jgi:hypothetical protein